MSQLLEGGNNKMLFFREKKPKTNKPQNISFNNPSILLETTPKCNINQQSP